MSSPSKVKTGKRSDFIRTRKEMRRAIIKVFKLRPLRIGVVDPEADDPGRWMMRVRITNRRLRAAIRRGGIKSVPRVSKGRFERMVMEMWAEQSALEMNWWSMGYDLSVFRPGEPVNWGTLMDKYVGDAVVC